jgi:hypothetical protein
MPYFIISLIIQLALVVHILKTGRGLMWVMIVLFFPLIGALAYFIVELLPELSQSRTAHNVRRGISKTVDPHKDFRSAEQNLAIADTVQNAILLGNQYLDKARYDEARDLYQRFLKGVHADDPVLLLGLARAHFGLGEFAEVVRVLDRLKEANPDFKSPEGHMLYARSQEALGDTAAAIHEYEALCRYYAGPEPTCRLALLLKQTGETQRAAELFQRVVEESRIAGRHYNTLYQEWVALARREASS